LGLARPCAKCNANFALSPRHRFAEAAGAHLEAACSIALQQAQAMTKHSPVRSSELLLTSVPAFWPMAMAATLLEEGAELYAKNLKFMEEDFKLHAELRPKLATPNRMRLDLRTMALRDYGDPSGFPTLVDAPHAGHTAVIADYHKGQSLIETLLANGIAHVALTDWKPATEDMKDFDIDTY
jgi:hypothetical protein